MTATYLDEWLKRSSNNERLLRQEQAILEGTELVCELMERQGVTRSELAARLGVSKPRVTQMLSGETNLTLRTLSDALWALGHGVRIQAESLSEGRTDWAGVPSETVKFTSAEAKGPRITWKNETESPGASSSSPMVA